jgi:hypothetical protein
VVAMTTKAFIFDLQFANSTNKKNKKIKNKKIDSDSHAHLIMMSSYSSSRLAVSRVSCLFSCHRVS